MANDAAQSWSRVQRMLGDGALPLGEQWSFNLRNDPKRLAFVLSRYKFAAKMAGSGKRVIELGCGEGIGAPILAERAAAYLGVDYDREAILSASANWASPSAAFLHADILDPFDAGSFDVAVSFDVIEHIHADFEGRFFHAVLTHLHSDGVAIVGTPNATAQAHASPISMRGHINTYTHARLRQAMRERFRVVFMFGGNDEIIHTGFPPMAHFLIAVGCGKKTEAP